MDARRILGQLLKRAATGGGRVSAKWILEKCSLLENTPMNEWKSDVLLDEPEEV